MWQQGPVSILQPPVMTGVERGGSVTPGLLQGPSRRRRPNSHMM